MKSKTDRDGKPGACGTCGAPGHHCFGPSEDGPSRDDWIGVANGKPCCHACYDGKSE
ncbi:hypothetical protein K3722_07640 [Leisingera caerulea]|uniref:Uncharacterized protein n=1 Tax=Leisingera caerulea TaxID=506591 RepID=A0ABY5X0G7_LEICA|nr:hypothetical protein [Leisingera caerulea]UWQ59991.1 hypothetical protein K3722_07625 [Leisingera caerulea]UWQ59994.1 hypothetical protein K3722_07640 [Leisingera caerulea]